MRRDGTGVACRQRENWSGRQRRVRLPDEVDWRQWPSTSTKSKSAGNHEIASAGKSAVIAASSDPAFRGDASRYNPEELFVGSLSACHMLWVLHLCADAGIVVASYSDQAAGVMIEEADGSGRFTEVVLRPRMAVTDESRIGEVIALHDRARQLCFLANSVRCPVRHEPVVTRA
jgi:organic hydroperoxide reductase OsmC/OhrA